MQKPRTWRQLIFGDLGLLILIAATSFLIHTLTNHQYGFHRDELATLDDARYLDWGYVAYPPVAPAIARVALTLFGPSLVGLRLFSSLAISIAIVLSGLMCSELGGRRAAQVVAALAVAISPIVFVQGTMFQYVSFDYLWWVLSAYCMLRLLKSNDPRWWLGVGAAIGLGMMTKYTMAFYVAGIVAGVLLTRTRRYLASPWLWGGVALSLLIFLPNLVWQARHGFVALEFLSHIHARDIEWGRTDGFLVEQFVVATNPFTLPLWVAGLWFYMFHRSGQPYRALGWMFVVTFLIMFAARSRSYYLAPAYPPLFAAGAMLWEQWLARRAAGPARLIRGVTWGALGMGVALVLAVTLPVIPVNSAWWHAVSDLDEHFREQIGWPELVETVSSVYAGLPAEERAGTAILASNYGEAGAINLYGPAYGLPEAISGIDSYWPRGYGDPPPQTVVVVGFAQDQIKQAFERCDLAAHITNRYGVENEETSNNPYILVCRNLRTSWPQFWQRLRSFG